MNSLNTVKRAIDKAMEWCCIIILAVMTVLVTYQVVTRYFFNDPSAISETMAQYLFVWMVMFGSAYVFGLREHLSITVLKDKLSPLLNFIVEILINFLLLAFSIGVCLLGGIQSSNIQMGTMDAALKIPMGVIYSTIPICGAVMVFYGIYNTVLAFHEYKNQISHGQDGTAGTM